MSSLLRHRKHWEDYEDRLLKDKWNEFIAGKMTLEELADLLHRRVWGIRHRAMKLNCYVHAAHWTKKEECILRNRWGTFVLETIAARLNKTPGAVIAKARYMKLPPVYWGTFSMAYIVRLTGYNQGAIKIAAERAGVKLKRLPMVTDRGPKARPKRSERYGIEQEDIDLIIDELKKMKNPNRIESTYDGEWGTGSKPECCRCCRTTERKHISRGLCARCYRRHSVSRTRNLFPVVKRFNDRTRVDYVEPNHTEDKES